jgi:hypothetical protein
MPYVSGKSKSNGRDKNELGINQGNKSGNEEEGDVEPEMGRH